ncbi:MAG: (Fe-S)-binding protein [Thermoleophilia bacterium]
MVSVMTSEIVTTFPSLREYERSVQLLRNLGIAFQVVTPAAAYRHVAVPAVVIDRSACARLNESGQFLSVGWVDYHPERDTGAAPATPMAPAGATGMKTDADTHTNADADADASQAGPAVDIDTEQHGSDIVGRPAVVLLAPCNVDEYQLRLVAHLPGDLTEVLPYLNAAVLSARYLLNANTLTYMLGYRMITLHARKMLMARIDGVGDGWRTLASSVSLINSTWAQRAAIKPSLDLRHTPAALELYRHLPRTNCRVCGEATCLAFAAKLRLGEVSLNACTPLTEPANASLRESLLGLWPYLQAPELESV